MINTIAELLSNFVEAEKEVLNKYDIKHCPTIGDMNEGLTQEIVNSAIFSGLNLVVSTQSFIEGCDTEFDVILAEGDGESIPYTCSKKYKTSQVIAVIQVKKTLTSTELHNSYDNLHHASDIFKKNIEGMDASMVNDTLIKICHKDMSSYKKGQLNQMEEYIYHTLVMDTFLPLRIVLGYNGFKTEKSLRDTYIKYLEGNMSSDVDRRPGYSPMSFPNLIICNNNSLVKLTGCPYSYPLNKIKDDWWEVMASTHYNPMHIFLEMLWTKLSYRFKNLPLEIFGEDLETEPFNIFLRAKIHLDSSGNPIGWDYEYSAIDERVLCQNNDPIAWNPVALDIAQSVILGRLSHQNIDISKDNSLESFVIENGYISLTDFIHKLSQTGFITIDGNIIKLITKQFVCAIAPDGNTYGADDYDGRFSRWLLKKMSSRD